MNDFNASLEAFWNTLEGWLEGLIANLPNIILAVLVLVASIFLSRFIKTYAGKVVSRFSGNHTINGLLANIITSGFLMVMLFVVLGILGLDRALTSLLAGAGVVGLAVGLAVQEPLMNLFSGILMSTKSLYNVGDLIETNGYFGKIRKVNLRSTILEQLSGEEVLLPNKSIIQNPLTNYTVSGRRRLALSCGISYGEDLEKVRAVTVKAVKDNVEYDERFPVEFYYEGYGDSSINFIVRFWLADITQKGLLNAQSESVIAIKKAFDQHDIMIPFPIRTLDFGIKGGEKLNTMLKASAMNGKE
ncbi:MAG: mechanosensitive ion channel family protein [Phaeodactylibacter xiamenensis]|uniref:mechanosensitive ion channel family protein n=1 Tax=Phaeodactylibacter xiamenensis TaxID=1524460 RepID=UPI0005C4D9A9|nr:mechanosensitive ion channel family protein [Phaeodactylibacter xiamenensis]MCR9052858.1 mechanosensitive ion channel family protein [bacterium]